MLLGKARLSLCREPQDLCRRRLTPSPELGCGQHTRETAAPRAPSPHLVSSLEAAHMLNLRYQLAKLFFLCPFLIYLTSQIYIAYMASLYLHFHMQHLCYAFLVFRFLLWLVLKIPFVLSLIFVPVSTKSTSTHINLHSVTIPILSLNYFLHISYLRILHYAYMSFIVFCLLSHESRSPRQRLHLFC